jgi:mannose-6-phosphate isomerase-like protein (cupin superfamily)
MLFSEIEGFEVARLPVGASIAEHTHTRTDEIYFIVAGSGRMTLDGDAMRVTPGDLIMLPRTHSHGLVNDGDEELQMVVIELLPPEIASRLQPRTPWSAT